MKPNTEKWLKFVQASSVPLVKVDEAGKPTDGMASGCLIEYSGNRLLFSVFHATQLSDSWVVPLRYNPERGQTEVFFAPAFCFLAETSPAAAQRGAFDLSFIPISQDVVPFFQHLEPSGLVEERKRPVFRTDLKETPQSDIPYAFAGQVIPDFIRDLDALCVKHCTYSGLTFEKTDGVYHYFKLPVDHPGHNAFTGCSGAPIVGYDRRVVALVTGGDIEANEVCGISIVAFKQAIDEFLKDSTTSESMQGTPTPD